MALILIKEDGTGKVDANSYADVTDADAYYDGHLYAAAWTAATADNKAKALVMATRLIDSQYQFNGWRSNDGQALQWPRAKCPDPDRGGPIALLRLPSVGVFVEDNFVPKAVVDATCEMGRELLLLDRTTAPPGEGITSVYDSAGGTKYSKWDTRPIISHVAQAMLSKFGASIGVKSGSVSLMRT